ncbi:MAG: hypothetical protein Q8P24_05750 [Desulfobacterales bacterium]|nr:hypothetical protein [Desulfobacterales bacterium]
MKDSAEKNELKKHAAYEEGPSEESENHPVSSNGRRPMDEKEVKLKLSLECSENFAKDVLNGLAYLWQGQGGARQREIHYTARDTEQMRPAIKIVRVGLQHVLSMPTVSENQIQDQENQPAPSSAKYLEQPANPKRQRMPLIIFSAVTVLLVAIGGYNYLDYKKNESLAVAGHNNTIRKEKAYHNILARYHEDLLNSLDELTANIKMRKLFPEITTMVNFARFKRGSDLAGKAKAAMEFIQVVKKRFDEWIDHPQDFYLKAGKKDMADFLVEWRKTEKLLNKLEAAQQDPFTILPQL